MKLEQIMTRLEDVTYTPETGSLSAICPLCGEKYLHMHELEPKGFYITCGHHCNVLEILDRVGIRNYDLLNPLPEDGPHDACFLPRFTKETAALTTLEDVDDEAPKYLWMPYLRENNFNVVQGDGGVGKTMLILAICAAITRGTKPPGMPGVLSTGPADVIYYGAEDDNEEYKHRAMLCGCDMRRLHLIKNGERIPQLQDIDAIRAQAKQVKAKLIVFDPLQYFLGAQTDMNRANEVRPLLEGIRRLCRELSMTVILVAHLNKATQQKAHYRAIGTVDIINASRSALMVGWHPRESGMRVAVHIKANAAHGQAVVFAIGDEGRFAWHGTADVDAGEVEGATRGKRSAPPEDPTVRLVVALMDKYPEGWSGTAAQMLAEGSALVDCSLITNPVTIGKRLPAVHHILAAMGITWQKTGKQHSFSRHTQGVLPVENIP